MENKGKYMNVLSLRCVDLYIYMKCCMFCSLLCRTPQANLFIYTLRFILSIVMNV